MASLQAYRAASFRIRKMHRDREAGVESARNDPHTQVDAGVQLMVMTAVARDAANLLPEEYGGECDEGCLEHAKGCDGNCDHLEGHVNACMVEDVL